MIGPKRSRRGLSNRNRISPQSGADADHCAWSVLSIAGRPPQRSPFACRGVRSWNGFFLCRCYGSCPEPLLRRQPNKSYTFQRKSVAGKRPMQSTLRSTRQSMGFKLTDVSFASTGKDRASRPIRLIGPSGAPRVAPDAHTAEAHARHQNGSACGCMSDDETAEAALASVQDAAAVD
jgi:hypothetical protein